MIHRRNGSTIWLALAAACVVSACAGSDSGPTGVPTATAPTITGQPQSLQATLGTTGKMVVVASGTEPMLIQWYHNGVAIVGAISDTLLIGPFAATDSGGYYAIVSNPAGSAQSVLARVTIVPVVSPKAWRQDGGAGASSDRTYESALADESAIYVFNNGLFTFNTPIVTKAGASTDLVASRDSGQNAAVRAAGNAHIYVNSATVTTDSAGAAAFYATGVGTRIAISGGTASTTGTDAPVIGASDGGIVDITGGTFSAAASNAMTLWGASGGGAPIAITIAGGATISGGTNVLARIGGGATATITLDAVTTTGFVIVESGSATLVLQNGSVWNGAMADGAVTLAGTSTWAVSSNSAVTVLSGAAISGGTVTNISGAFTVTYDASLPANAVLAGGTYTLTGGGQLKPQP